MRIKPVMWLSLLIAAVLLVALLLIAGALIGNRAPLFDAPGPVARLGIYLRENVAQTRRDPALPELAPLDLTVGVEQAVQEVERAAAELGWQAIVVDAANARLRAVVTTALFRFHDDIQVQVLARGGQQAEVMVRASSRTGRGDLGANAHHIMRLREALARRGVLQGIVR